MTTVSPTVPPRAGRVRRTVAAVLLGATMLTGPALAGYVASDAQTTPVQTAPAATAQASPASFADLAARVTPAVVNIAATQEAKPERARPQLPGLGPGMPGFPPGSPFEEFFRRFQEQQGQEQQGMDPGDQDQRPRGRGVSAGSGFIVDPAGFVVTNNHVIDGAAEITVTLQDGTALPAKLVGRDGKTDIALLKVESSKPLPALEWGDSDAARVGDWVMAVGNPFGLGGTVTKGIVSARGRNIHSGPYDDFLQLDAAINRGNSGGPTFDLGGRVIGINTAIYSPNGGSVGIGFAIPSNLAKQVVAQLKETGTVERGWLGVRIQAVTPEIAESVGLPDAKGALVAEVTPDSPAARAGLRQGDVILTYDGKPVNELRDLTRRVAETKVGNEVTLRLIRDGRETSLPVRIDRLADQQVASAGPAPAEKHTVEAVKGLQLAPLDSAVRQRLGLDDGVRGVVVTGLTGQGGEQPVRPGDVILRVGEDAVKTPADVSRKVAEAEKAGRKAVLVLINRQGNESFVALRLDRA